eukprot:5805667-Prymnesium_polylepis.2
MRRGAAQTCAAPWPCALRRAIFGGLARNPLRVRPARPQHQFLGRVPLSPSSRTSAEVAAAT